MCYICIYIRPILSTVDDYIHINIARRPWATDGPRLWRERPDIKTISGRHRIDADPRSALLCNPLCSCFSQCDLTCTVGINWATALNNTAIGSCTRCLFSQALLTCARWIHWAARFLARRRCESLLASAVWINWTAQLCLVAEFDIE